MASLVLELVVCLFQVLAADAQLKMVPLGVDNLIQIPEETRQKVYLRGQQGGGGVNSKSEGGPDGSGDKSKKRVWGAGEMEFEALMRNLDNAVSVYTTSMNTATSKLEVFVDGLCLVFQGYRTGYVYKQPLVKEEPPKPKDDKVELPPAVSSLGYLLEEENFYKDGSVFNFSLKYGNI